MWFEILESQIETGNPYILYKDHANNKSNQKNLGTIKSSNLCTEIIEYTSPDEVAVCNLASIALNMFVKEDSTYDFQKLYEITKVITRNLNKVIDVNYYPVEETIYYAAMEASMELSKKEGAYESYKGSPVSKSIFQFDMWGVTPDSGRWDWT